MARKTKPAPANGPALRAPQQIERDTFARRLHAAMQDKGMSNSDLARAVWGDVTDSQGYKVAKNRDRVAVYLKGTGFPEPATLHKIAEAVGVSKDDLAPTMASSAIDADRPEFAISMVSGSIDKCHVQINALLPLTVAMEIGKLYEASKRKAVPGVDTDIAEGQ